METPYKEAQLILAIQAMKNDPNLSTWAAAAAYGVPHSTLSAHLTGRTSCRNSLPNSRKLTQLEEEAVVEYILDMDSRSYPPWLVDVAAIANLLLAAQRKPPIGVNWASSFIKRQPALKTCQLYRYDYKRALYEDPDAINIWFCLMRNIVAKYSITDADIYNFDETGFIMGVISTGKVITNSERHSNAKLVQPGNRQ
ncbi:hypothetical protein V491_00668 [Pseudogymnoascus sp. VKM F-3775]|nr:hypothetical protein V491_00668 [Pseudogymnoascus sp. VKM F-3775]